MGGEWTERSSLAIYLLLLPHAVSLPLSFSFLQACDSKKKVGKMAKKEYRTINRGNENFLVDDLHSRFHGYQSTPILSLTFFLNKGKDGWLTI